MTLRNIMSHKNVAQLHCSLGKQAQAHVEVTYEWLDRRHKKCVTELPRSGRARKRRLAPGVISAEATLER